MKIDFLLLIKYNYPKLAYNYMFFYKIAFKELIIMKKILFKGCCTAMATPFTENGINYTEFEKLINNQIEAGIDAILVCGTTGESSTMTESEKKEAIKFAVEITNKRVPVIAGTGGNNTKSVIEMSKYAESVGVDGLLIVTPYYNKTTQSRFSCSLHCYC